MAKLGKTELPQTASDFVVVGKLKGTEKEKFYEQKVDKNGNAYRQVKFGIEFEDGKTIYVSLKGQEQKDAYFSKRGDKEKNIKSETKHVEWSKRFSFKEQGFFPLGVSFKFEKDEDGVKKYAQTLWDYDACATISQKLSELGDGTVLRVTGKIERFTTKEGNVISKFVITKIYLSEAELGEEHLKNHYFHQTMVVSGVETVIDEETKKTTYFIEGYDCNFNNIVPISFPTEQVKLIQNFKKKLKNGYFAITVFGDIRVSKEEVEVESNDEYGESDVTLSTNGFTTYDLFVRGADADSLDLETYTKESIERAIELTQNAKVASDDYGDSNEVIEAVDDDDINAELAGW